MVRPNRGIETVREIALRCTILGFALAFGPGPAWAEIITRLPAAFMAHEPKAIALTFDACQGRDPTILDPAITQALAAAGIPFSIFVGGKFARDHGPDLKAFLADKDVTLGNHSWAHNNNMPELDDAAFRADLTRAQQEIRAATGRAPAFFRFPAGVSDARSQRLAAEMGFRIIHWRWASGDPDPHQGAAALTQRVLEKTRAGDILIFHINGRALHTGKALPAIIAGLREKGFTFVSLERAFGPSNPPNPAAAAP